jgi:hypothetical protein
MDLFELSRAWWAYAAENRVKPIHHTLYFYIINKANSLHWKEEIGLPTGYTLEMLGTSSYKTYIAALEDLQTFGFIKVVERAKNQHTSNVVALVNSTKADTKADTKAGSKHIPKQVHHKKTSKNSKESKNNKTDFIAPTLEQFVSFWQENGYDTEKAKNVFHGYNDNNWKDTHGTKIQNWKSKVRFVWFKPENKKQLTQANYTTLTP